MPRGDTAALAMEPPALSSNDDIASLTATELRGRYLRRELSPPEVVTALAARVEAINPVLNAVIEAPIEQALAAARASEARYARGAALPLDGVPVGVKDLVDTAGIRTTRGSAIFATRVPARDAAVVARLRQAGAVILAKTTTHEFAWGVTTDSPYRGPTRNPWALDLVAGGSSGGSAAAIAAMLVPLAIGTDTAGSIRIPAAFCGIVGLRPTYGTIDTSGAFPLAPSLDTVGPMARTVADTALLAAAIAPGPRRHPRPPHDLMAERLVVAICPDLDDVEPAPAVRSALSSAAATFADLGARVVEVPVPQIAPLFGTLGTIVMAEGRHVHRRAGLWPSRRDEYGPDVRARLERAASVTLTRYLDAQDLRRRVAAAMHAVFRTADVLLSPASTVSPIPVGSRSADPPDGAVSFREQVMTPAAPQSLAGLPACVVRAGFDDRGVPVGVQLTAPAGADADLLAVAARYEEATAAIQRRAAPDPPPGWASGSP